jgi:hypothetical protein
MVYLQPKDGEDKSSPTKRPAPTPAPPAASPGVAGDYPTLCVKCGSLVLLDPVQAVLSEARACVGDLTFAVCGRCIQRAAARMVDDA